jgi:type IV pilus assembly protein PilF
MKLRLLAITANSAIRNAILIAVVACLPACVTTGDEGLSPLDQAEVARLNRDLGISYMQQGKLEESLYKLNKSLAAAPENSATLRVAAYVYERLGDLPRAEDHYRRAARFGDDDQGAQNALAVFLCRYTDNKRESIQYFDRALEIPDYQFRYEIFTNAGTCARDFDAELAEKYLQQGLALNPSFPTALYHMADISYLSENYLQARAFLERCAEVADSGPALLWLGVRIESALGDQVAADKLGVQLLNDFPESSQARELMDMQRDAG